MQLELVQEQLQSAVMRGRTLPQLGVKAQVDVVKIQAELMTQSVVSRLVELQVAMVQLVWMPAAWIPQRSPPLCTLCHTPLPSRDPLRTP